MGLLLTRDETLQSAEILCYGKKILFRGNLLPPECKVFARTTLVSNDQISSFANILSTVSTNSLTMAQHNESIRVPTELFAYFSCVSIAILAKFNYILKRGASELNLDRPDVWWRLLYLDHSLSYSSIPGSCHRGLIFLERNFPLHIQSRAEELRRDSGEGRKPISLIISHVSKAHVPEVLSEFMSATFLGIATQLVGIFQNSKTIRRMFQRKFSKRIDRLVIDSERKTLSSTQAIPHSGEAGVGVWDCSATQADILRERSWGGPVVGATVPHPFEYLNRYSQGGLSAGNALNLRCSIPTHP